MNHISQGRSTRKPEVVDLGEKITNDLPPATRSAKPNSINWGEIQSYFAPAPTSTRNYLIEYQPFALQQLSRPAESKSFRTGDAVKSHKLHQFIWQIQDQLTCQAEKAPLLQDYKLSQVREGLELSIFRRKFFKFFSPSKKVSQLATEILFYGKYLARLTAKNRTSFDKLLLDNELQYVQDWVSASVEVTDRLHKIFVTRTLSEGVSRILTENDHAQLFKTSKDNLRDKIAKLSKQKITRGLKFSCCVCFGNKSSQLNQLRGCSQCGQKLHKACLGNSSRGRFVCQNCALKTGRLENCLYCGVKGLSAREGCVEGQMQTYHPACLVMAGNAVYKNGAIVPRRQLPHFTSSCRFCGLSRGYPVRCRVCKQSSHPLCAYLMGSTIKSEILVGEGMQVFTEVDCCSAELDRAAQSYLRQVLVNYAGASLKLFEQARVEWWPAPEKPEPQPEPIEEEPKEITDFGIFDEI